MFLLLLILSAALEGLNVLAQSPHQVLMLNITYSDRGIYGGPGYWAYEGEFVKISCELPETLKHADQPINFNDSRIRLAEESTSKSNYTHVIISNISYGDEGMYTCGENNRALLHVLKPNLDGDEKTVDGNASYCVVYPQGFSCNFFITASLSLPLHYRVTYSIYSSRSIAITRRNDCENLEFRSSMTVTGNQSELLCRESTNLLKDYFYLFEITGFSPLYNTTSTYNITLTFDTYGELPCKTLNISQVYESLVLTYGFDWSIPKSKTHSESSLGGVATHGVQYDIAVSFTNHSDLIKTSSSVVSYSLNQLNKLTLDVPVLPYTKYSVLMQCRPATSIIKQTWTNPVKLDFTTMQAKPQAAPKIPGCGFSVTDSADDSIFVRLYWQEVSAISGHGNGPIIGYFVSIDAPTNQDNMTLIEKLQADVKLEAKKDNVAFVTAVNRVGAGNISAEIVIPKQTPRLKLHQCDFTVEENGQSSVTIRWNSRLNVTVYTCERTEGSCTTLKPIVSLPVSHDASSYQLNLSQPLTSKPARFGLSYGDGETCSGIVWANCVYSTTSSYFELPEITVKFVLNIAYIDFRLQCETRTAKADTFVISWCETTDSVCHEVSSLKVNHCHLEESISIVLKYSTKYEFWMTAHKKGLSTRYGTPINLTSPRRELLLSHWVMIALFGVVLPLALIAAISISSYRQYMKLKAVRSPVMLSPVPLEDVAFRMREGDDNYRSCTADSGFLEIDASSDYWKQLFETNISKSADVASCSSDEAVLTNEGKEDVEYRSDEFQDTLSLQTDAKVYVQCAEIVGPERDHSEYQYRPIDDSFVYTAFPTIEPPSPQPTDYSTDDDS